jgi:hypothetical protein
VSSGDAAATLTGKTGAGGFARINSATTNSFKIEYGTDATASKPLTLTGTANGSFTAAVNGNDLTFTGAATLTASNGTYSKTFTILAGQPVYIDYDLGGNSPNDGGTPANGGNVGSPADTNSALSAASAVFSSDPASSNYKDVSVTLTPNGRILKQITLGGKALTEGADYTKNGNTYTFKRAYLATLGAGSHAFTFEMSGGTNPTFTIIISKDGTATPLKPWTDPFTDVKSGAWYYDNVKFVYQYGLFDGTSATTFSPDTPMTRGMLVTVLGRYYGVDVSKYTGGSFDDVDGSQYYAAYIEWAKENGIVSGIGGNKFAPETPVSRQDMAVILKNYADFMGIKLPVTRDYDGFLDYADVANYAKEAIEAFFKAQVISGRQGNIFDPQDEATRAEVAAILHRFIENTK